MLLSIQVEYVVQLMVSGSCVSLGSGGVMGVVEMVGEEGAITADSHWGRHGVRSQRLCILSYQTKQKSDASVSCVAVMGKK